MPESPTEIARCSWPRVGRSTYTASDRSQRSPAGLPARSSREAALDRVACCRRAGADAELPVDRVQVRVHRPEADDQLLGHLRRGGGPPPPPPPPAAAPPSSPAPRAGGGPRRGAGGWGAGGRAGPAPG